MTRRMIPVIVAALFVSACMTAAQKKDKSNAEADVVAATASVAAAKLAGGEAYAPAQMRAAENDLQMAQVKLKAGDWNEADRHARLATSVADEARSEAEAARKRGSAAKPPTLKPGPANKKARIVAPKERP